MNAFEERPIENSVSAQKRAEVKLDSPRATAKRSVRRPASASAGMPDGFLSTLLLTLLLMAATLFLLFARLTDRPTALPEIAAAISNWTGGQSAQPSAEIKADEINRVTNNPIDVDASSEISSANSSNDGETVSAPQVGGAIGEPAMALLYESDFSNAIFPLARDNQQDDRKWLMDFVPGENVYRIRVFPGYAAWSTLGFELTPPFRVETSATVVMDEPSGYAGLLARYQDPSNFYLFNVDGEGQSQLLSQIDGEWSTLLPWTPTEGINPAGTMNELAVKDDGQFLTFYINGSPIHEVEPMITAGLVGLAGGTRVQNPAESDFEWIRVYGNP